MPDSISITLPLPFKGLRPNDRSHWIVKSKATKRYRTAAWAECHVALQHHDPPRWKSAEFSYRFTYRRRARRDSDNLLAAMKSAIDGIVDAGIVVDDSRVTHVSPEIVIDPDAEPCVLVTVRPT